MVQTVWVIVYVWTMENVMQKVENVIVQMVGLVPRVNLHVLLVNMVLTVCLHVIAQMVQVVKKKMVLVYV